MKKLLLVTFLFSGCATEPMPENTSHVYRGIVRQYLQDSVKAVSDITITYYDNKGTFESHGKLLFRDSIRIVVQSEDEFHGYVFFDNMSFDSAFAFMKNTLQPINFIIKGDSLNGKLPADWLGFRYEFYTKKI